MAVVVDGRSQWRMVYSGTRNTYNTTSNSILPGTNPDPDPDPEEVFLQVHICIRRIHRFHYIDADGLILGDFDIPAGILWQHSMAFSLNRNSEGCFLELQSVILSSGRVPRELSLRIAASVFRYASRLYLPEQGMSSSVTELAVTADLTFITTEEVRLPLPLPPQQHWERVDESFVLDAEPFEDLQAGQSSSAAMTGGQNLGDCPICLDDLFPTGGDSKSRRKLSETPCSHVFHDHCICRWLDTNPTCPLCRSVIS